MAATAVWALWTTAEHVSLMARPTTDDNITLYDDAVFCDSERLKDVRVDPAGLACSWNARSRHLVTCTECRDQAAE